MRLKGYDYGQSGAYFVTVCTQGRTCLFGNVAEGQMQSNEAGRMVERWWLELNRKFPTVKTDDYVVMPNHFHGILAIQVGADLRVGPAPEGAHTGAPLPTIVQWFKTMTTNEYIRGVKSASWPSFNGQLWQRSFYEHVIRDDGSLNRIRQYILDNPARWAFDRENPQAGAPEPENAWLA